MTDTRPLITTFDELFVRHAPRDLFHGDDGRRFLYGDVLRLAQTPEFMGTRRALVLCLLDNVPGALLGYLALMSAQAVPMNVGTPCPMLGWPSCWCATGQSSSGCLSRVWPSSPEPMCAMCWRAIAWWRCRPTAA